MKAKEYKTWFQKDAQAALANLVMEFKDLVKQRGDTDNAVSAAIKETNQKIRAIEREWLDFEFYGLLETLYPDLKKRLDSVERHEYNNHQKQRQLLFIKQQRQQNANEEPIVRFLLNFAARCEAKDMFETV